MPNSVSTDTHDIDDTAIVRSAPPDINRAEVLESYLSEVADTLLRATDATKIGIYLLDRATRRLTLVAMAAIGDTTKAVGVPEDLGRRGIDGCELDAATLRDFVHAAPRAQRIAAPIRDGSSWFGVVAGITSTQFSARSSTRFREVARALDRELHPIAASHGDNVVEEDEEQAMDRPSAAIYGDGIGEAVVTGPALLFWSAPERQGRQRKVEEDRRQSTERLDRAIAATEAELQELLGDTESELYDVVSLLFSTHLLMLTDEAFSGAIRDLVAAGQTPEDAVQATVASFVRTFSKLREARLAEKAHDVRDIGRRLLANLSGEEEARGTMAGSIVVADDVLPSDLVRMVMERAAGLVICGATLTAHISILAQSLSLPVLLTSDRRALEIASDTPLMLDAHEGTLHISPAAEELALHGLAVTSSLTTAVPRADADNPVPCDDSDLCGLKILATVNLLGDARHGAASGADGIGLYRSEFPFIIRNDYVDEAEQLGVYRPIVATAAGKPVVLRTMDIGGDKLLAGREEERNPFLGVRGIRFSLANRELFREQLRAMLQAGADSDLHIMFPMVSGVDEIRQAREEVELCIDQLTREGRRHHGSPRIGAMVELPAAVISIEELAHETDFLSVGTNDLTMYLLAVDRTNDRLSELYRSHHPVVLRTLADIARRVGDGLSDLSICGEAAADPLMVPFFLGIGVRKLSVAPRQIPHVRSTAARYDRETAGTYAESVLAIRSLSEMDGFLKAYRHPDVPPEVPPRHP